METLKKKNTGDEKKRRPTPWQTVVFRSRSTRGEGGATHTHTPKNGRERRKKKHFFFIVFLGGGWLR
jgi:hypothetical protein